MKTISIKIGGEAGQGVKVSGFIITKAIKDLGYWTFSYSEYPSLIRGGDNTFQIDISDEKIKSIKQDVDIMVVLHSREIDAHIHELNEGGILMFDNDIILSERSKKIIAEKSIKQVIIPIDEIVKKNAGVPVMSNSVLNGALWAIISNDFDVVKERIKKSLGNKEIEKNLACAKDGFDSVKKQKINQFILQKAEKKDTIVGTGNEIAGLSIIASGTRYFAAYPMTPASSILQYLADKAEQTKMIVKQAEDEISAIILTIGASFAGTRAATATSGGGLALMTEAISLAGMAEIPIVIFNSQRPAPATGVPTWTEQGDLSFVTNIGHGDFPRIILAPGDLDETFELSSKAFNLAEKFQTVVIVLLDKYLSESWYQTQKLDLEKITVDRGEIVFGDDLLNESNFLRYKYTENGISKRSIPGTKNGIYLANSDEHDEKGYSTEDGEIRKKMMQKRMKKINSILNELPEPELIGDKDAKITILVWGSQKGPVEDAVKDLKKDNKNLNILHYSYLFPLKTEKLRTIFKKNKIIAVENNYSGHLCKLIKQETGISIENTILKYDGKPFFRDELVKKISELI